MLTLRPINLEDADEEYACLQDLPSENGFENHACGLDFETFQHRFVPGCQNSSKGIGLRPAYVPQTWYFLWDDEKAVAVFKIRHYLNDALREGSGHIGYGVRRSERGHGYATRGLQLALEEARRIVPEDEIRMSVHKTNPSSLRVMLKCGARIRREDEEHWYTCIQK